MKISLYIFVLLSVLLVGDCVLYYYYQMSLAGYYSDIILFWLWFLMGFVVITIFWKKMMAKLFLGVMILAAILSILPMALPFYMFVLSMTSAGLHIETDLNEKYRAQIVGYSVMSHPWLEIIERRGLLEKKLYECTEMDIERLKKERIDVKFDAQLRREMRISEAKNIYLDSETDSRLNINLFYGGPNKTLTFDKADKRLIKIKEK